MVNGLIVEKLEEECKQLSRNKQILCNSHNFADIDNSIQIIEQHKIGNEMINILVSNFEYEKFISLFNI